MLFSIIVGCSIDDDWVGSEKEKKKRIDSVVRLSTVDEFSTLFILDVAAGNELLRERERRRQKGKCHRSDTDDGRPMAVHHHSSFISLCGAQTSGKTH